MSELEASAFGKQGPINVGNDAEIIIYHTTDRGKTTEALRIPFTYWDEDYCEMAFEEFTKSVHNTAAALKDTYAHWPDGCIHIQTVINDKDVNILCGV